MRKFIKISTLILSFTFLTGFLPISGLLGPAATIFSSGNVYKAGLQLFVDQSIQKKTGKNSLTFVKEEIEKKNNTKKFNDQLRKLVERRVKIARQKIQLQNINQ